MTPAATAASSPLEDSSDIMVDGRMKGGYRFLATVLLNPTKGYACETGEIFEGSAQTLGLGKTKVWFTSHNDLVF